MAHLYGAQRKTPNPAAQVRAARLVEACTVLLDAPPQMLMKAAGGLADLVGAPVEAADVAVVVDRVLHSAGVLAAKADEFDRRAQTFPNRQVADAYGARAAELRKRDRAIAEEPADTPLTASSPRRAEYLAKAEAALAAGQRNLADGYYARANGHV